MSLIQVQMVDGPRTVTSPAEAVELLNSGGAALWIDGNAVNFGWTEGGRHYDTTAGRSHTFTLDNIWIVTSNGRVPLTNLNFGATGSVLSGDGESLHPLIVGGIVYALYKILR